MSLGMYRIEEIQDPSRLCELRESWSDLLTRTPRADFFHTSSWLEVYWRFFGSNQRLRVLVLRERGEPTAIVPLVIRSQRTRLGSFRVLAFPLDHWGSLYGPLGPNRAAAISAALGYLARQRRDWDFVDLRWLAASAGDHDEVLDAMRIAGISPYRRPDHQIPVVDLRSSWEAYCASRSPNWRSNCRRNENKINRAGEVQYLRYRPRGVELGDADPRWDLLQHCERIAAASWQGRSTNGTTLSHSSIRAFLQAMHAEAAKAGGLDVNLLLLDGQPVAFNYNYHYRGYVSSLRLGFDPQFSRLGVGTVLTYRMLQDSFRRGDRTFDLLPGSLDVKSKWRTSLLDSHRYEHFPICAGRVEMLRARRWLQTRFPRRVAQVA